MKMMKKTAWFHAVGSTLLAAAFGLAVATTATAEVCDEDVDESGEVNIDDLMAVIAGWGNEECEAPFEGDPLYNWQITSHYGQHPSRGLSWMNSSGTEFVVYDHNGGGHAPSTANWSDFNMAPGHLYKGPSSDTDVLQISFQLDMSKMTGLYSPVNPALFLIGMYDPSNPDQPFNYNTDAGLWYYSDANNPPGVLGCDAPGVPPCTDCNSPECHQYYSHCVNGTIGVTTAELDLFEMGNAKGNVESGGTLAPVDYLPNVMQVTTHAHDVGGAQGLFIGLRDMSIHDFGGDCIGALTDNPQNPPYPLQLLTCQDPPYNNYLDLQIDQPFHLRYEIFKTHMYIKVKQGSIDKVMKFVGSDGEGIQDWEHFQYFAIQASVNDTYNPANVCNLGGSQGMPTPPVTGYFTVKDFLVELRPHGGTFAPVEPVELSAGCNNGFFWGTDECGEPGYPLPVK